jgi:crotonyl-CoA carboxylase/reductase
MVVTCAGTTGYSAVVDLRYHWTRQKRFQGSHGTNDQQAIEFNKMLTSGAIHPALGEVLTFDEIPDAHQRMHEGDLALGNTAILIGAPTKGLGKK